MSKLKFEYNIRGYRYAPESFHIYKGLPGQKKKEIPLSDEQRQQMGYLCLTEGVKSAVDYVKHIERERERKCRQYMTYGFMLKENPHEYVYCPSLRCRESDTLKTRYVFCRRFVKNWPGIKAEWSKALNAIWMGTTVLSISESFMRLKTFAVLSWFGCMLCEQGEIMKQLGNLSIVCAQRTDVLMQIYGGQVSVHVGEGPERTSLFAAWDDDEVIQRIIHELNFGRYAIKEKRNSKENVA